MKIYTKIIGTGMCVPETIISNKAISDNPDWVQETLGIKTRRISNLNEDSLYLGTVSGGNAIRNAKISFDDIDMVIVATSTPSQTTPSMASIIKDNLGLSNAFPFDVAAVCNGFTVGLSVANQYIISGTYKNILVIGTDTFSKITNWDDRNSVFFGDGSGAMVVSSSTETGFHGFSLGSSSVNRLGFDCKLGDTFTMNGRQVYDTAIEHLPKMINEVLETSKMTIDDISYVVPHQPSIKILREVAKRIGIDESKVMRNMDKYGNTVSATIPILFHETKDKFKKGDKILFASIGAGWTYGASIYEI